jgi:hypothetical protein
MIWGPTGGGWATGDHAAEDPVLLRELSLNSYLRVDDVSQAALGGAVHVETRVEGA